MYINGRIAKSTIVGKDLAKAVKSKNGQDEEELTLQMLDYCATVVGISMTTKAKKTFVLSKIKKEKDKTSFYLQSTLEA